jgi:seryl-tRNA synthetase
MNINALKNFNADRLDIDEMVGLLADSKALRTEYEALQIEEPEYIDTTIKAIRREINARNADKIAARKRELAARIDSLKTPLQKKKELEEELAKLEALPVYLIFLLAFPIDLMYSFFMQTMTKHVRTITIAKRMGWGVV